MTDSTYEKGQSLETEVANVYQTLGFDIERNINLGGSQIDMVVRKFTSGVGQITCMIEVKSSKSNIGINDIVKFLQIADRLIRQGEIQLAICVTDANFTEDARVGTTANAAIRLLTLKELTHDLFSATQSLVRWTTQFERTPLFSEYIELKGHTVAGREIEDVAGYVNSWLKTQQSLLIISGDFGTGKTTLSERIFYSQAKHYLLKNDLPLPILMHLRNLKKYARVFEFVEASVKKMLGIAITQSYFETQLNSGRLSILLDGFDEIDTGATASDRARYMQRLSYLIGRGSPCVITTRPTYFDSFGEFAKVLRLKWPS